MDAADANDSGSVDTGDAIAALVFFFLGGAPLPPPGPSCGVDETLDGLSCVAYASCEGGLPDLAVVDFEVQSATIRSSGILMRTRVVLRNVGGRPSGEFSVDISSGVGEVRAPAPSLAPGETGVIRPEFKIDLAHQGKEVVMRARADSADVVDESDDTNNDFLIIFAFPSLPDVVVTNLAPAFECSGEGLVALPTIVIENLGGKASGPFEAHFRSSIGNGNFVFDSLEPGESRSEPLTLEFGSIHAGKTVEFRRLVDATELVSEFDEDNNGFRSLVSIPAETDLSLRGIDIGDAVDSSGRGFGVSIGLNIDIVGAVPAEPFQLRIQSTIGNRVAELTSENLSLLRLGFNRIVVFVPLNEIHDGKTVQFTATVDSGNSVCETDEDNNVKSDVGTT